ncbi:MAG TPA: zinc ribbon domain-containing protein [Thermoleophilaceae bacterium]
MSQPDLFVVCKNCGSEVSPYVTECPYCGQRVRKRAPKIERGEEEPRRRQRTRRARSLPKMRRGEIPGIRIDTRPYGTILLILVALVASVARATGEVTVHDLGAIFGGLPLGNDYWRLVAAPFVHDNAGYAFIALLAVGVFGIALEQRFNLFVPLVIFLAAGAAGAGLVVGLDAGDTWGANAAALGLLSAWAVEWRLTRNDEDTDRIGLWVFAAVLFGLSAAWPAANIVAAVGGAAVGSLAGLMLAQRNR